MYSLIKSTLISFVFPVPLCLAIFSIGLVFLWRTRKQKAGKIIITTGYFILLLFSFPFLPNLLLGHLEQKYPALIKEQNKKYDFLNIKFIVVLAGNHVLDPRLPITSQFSHAGLVRLVEGIRLYNNFRGTQLILSGGVGRDPISDAELMAALSIALGIPENDIILESKSRNTYQEAIYIKPIVKDQKFILVTSANHMPRSMALFKKLAMKPIPAPTGHLVKNYGKSISVIPSGFQLRKSYIMIYEYLALAKDKLLGRI
ncbi:Membrane Protein Functionally coupled to the MukBEF Chromosome Partitioning Mechanism [Olavius sp. associated proteobacterium Delta 1]|nr:Membrane Protein Functionally coupled to the MukBEF Chromosome Partitioning Mechanism [Olavius sp. associated proteobacterium Delta 1]